MIDPRPRAGQCPDCGSPLTSERWAPGQCLSCLIDLGLGAKGSGGETGTEHSTLSVESPAITPGQVLGNRYRIRSRLGSGGMGEVFRALDLKLRVDVALKAVRPSLLAVERALGALRQEVRAAREVVSPNVCRVFDLVELDGRELVSMEFVDGVTLAEVLRERSPIPLQEARELASQFLAGLEAIHAAGLVHRDVKPENLMLTRSGRVVVMDFGIARVMTDARSGTRSGTPAYMAPEQAWGEAIDARADVFSAGVVLCEMVAPGGTRAQDARQAVRAGVHRDPPEVGDTPWAAVLRKAVTKTREHRHPTAAALARALEEVTLRTAGDEAQRPYPGLASFTEQDAAFFVGRELEIEEMWKRLRRPRLLALIGPSGAGKSSFLRAGLLPTAPPGWRVIIATPRDRPLAALAQALAPDLTGDAEAIAQLIDFENPDVAIGVVSRWRRRHEQALLVLDQFEELFTQSPREVQERFAQLLARLPLEADVHVLLSMRDDFLFHCHRFESLAPVFSELSAIGPPTGAALRRALVQPSLKCGYRFEDEAIVEEMLSQVAGERAALPLVAFAMARLWDRRDRERGLLTRSAYDEMGGVSGALAQHAEATLDRIGQARAPFVREIFRNLVTALGTRATLDRDELLSVFAQPSPAEAGEERVRPEDARAVLDALVDARLLTSFEAPSDDRGQEGRTRIEIVHESLLSAWPRLVRWRTQDQDGAQLRDQLRQVARMWEERGQPEDLLWTGTSFREYELWRERYSGQLTSSEDAFARAMTARTRRQRQRRRLALGAVVAAALAVAAGMGVLWRRSEGARAQAVAAARQAEAQQTFALGQLELERNPTAALAFAISSLEYADTKHARLLALRALWRGPTAFALAATDKQGPGPILGFSPDGRFLANVEQATGTVRLWEKDGSGRVLPGTGVGWPSLGWSSDSRLLVVTQAESARIYSLPEGELVRTIDESFRWGVVGGQDLVTGHLLDPLPDGRTRRLVKTRRLPDGEPASLGVWTTPPNTGFWVDPLRQRLFGQDRAGLYELPFRGIEGAKPRRVVAALGPDLLWSVAPDGERVFTWDASGEGRIWSRATGKRLPGPRIDKNAEQRWWTTTSSLDGSWLAAATGEAGAVFLWDLGGPVGAEPRTLRRDARLLSAAFDPKGSWLATRDNRFLSLWPLTSRHPQVLKAPRKELWALAIDPHGKWVAAGGQTARQVWLWPLSSDAGAERTTLEAGGTVHKLAVSPHGDRLAAGTSSGPRLVPLKGPSEALPGFQGGGGVQGLAFDPEGRRLAVGNAGIEFPKDRVVRVFDLDTRTAQVLDAGDARSLFSVEFWPDGRVLAAGGGARLWDVAAARSTLVLEGVAIAHRSPDGRQLLGLRATVGPGGVVGTALVYDLEREEARPLETHGSEVTSLAWDPKGRFVVTGSRDGVVRVGPTTGEEPHLLFGHEGGIRDVEVAPGGGWIASAAEDGTVRLWPLPPEEGPFHTLPLTELLHRLRSLTNFRIVRDPAAAGGYRLDFEPFTGWNREPPTW